MFLNKNALELLTLVFTAEGKCFFQTICLPCMQKKHEKHFNTHLKMWQDVEIAQKSRKRPNFSLFVCLLC